MTWIFTIIFPLLMGGPVTVTIESATEPQCGKVRALLVQQLDQHRSNATVSLCKVK